MGIKTAKENFSKGEIIDILKQNVTLFKNEPEFVEYIVNLALYLIDQAYCVSGERSGDLENVLNDLVKVRGMMDKKIAEKKAPASDNDPIDEHVEMGGQTAKLEFLMEEMDASLAEAEDESPTTNKMRLQLYNPVIKSPPPISDEEEPATAKMSPEEMMAADEDLILPDQEEEREEPKTRQLKSIGIMTPMPSGGLTKDKEERKSPKIEVDDKKGRARVYKVVRSYSASQSGEMVCPICGTDTRGSSRCPSCGHML